MSTYFVEENKFKTILTLVSATFFNPSSLITLCTFSFLSFHVHVDGNLRAAEKAIFSLTVSVPIKVSACMDIGQLNVHLYRLILTCGTYADSNLKSTGWFSPLINTTPLNPFLLLWPARISSNLWTNVVDEVPIRHNNVIVMAGRDTLIINYIMTSMTHVVLPLPVAPNMAFRPVFIMPL